MYYLECFKNGKLYLFSFNSIMDFAEFELTNNITDWTLSCDEDPDNTYTHLTKDQISSGDFEWKER